MSKKYSIIYFGTSRDSALVLEKLLESNLTIKAVVTKSHKPVGRNNEIASTDVKKIAQKYDIPVFQNIHSLNIGKILSGYVPDVGVVFAYGNILPNAILNIFPLGIINLHPSLLP